MYTYRPVGKISQDVVRRDILRELDKPGAVNIGLIDSMCRHALDAGYQYIERDVLPDGCECVIGEDSSMTEIVQRILVDADLAADQPL